jgi:hypothetical protein
MTGSFVEKYLEKPSMLSIAVIRPDPNTSAVAVGCLNSIWTYDRSSLVFLVDFRQLGAHLPTPFWSKYDSDSGFGTTEHQQTARARACACSASRCCYFIAHYLPVEKICRCCSRAKLADSLPFTGLTSNVLRTSKFESKCVTFREILVNASTQMLKSWRLERF